MKTEECGEQRTLKMTQASTDTLAPSAGGECLIPAALRGCCILTGTVYLQRKSTGHPNINGPEINCGAKSQSQQWVQGGDIPAR